MTTTDHPPHSGRPDRACHGDHLRRRTKPKFDVTWAWAFEVQTDQGAGSPMITFKQDGEKLTGHYVGTFGESDLTGTVTGADISFSFGASVQGISLTSTYKGTVESDTTMKGTVTIEQVGGGTFTAKKK